MLDRRHFLSGLAASAGVIATTGGARSQSPEPVYFVAGYDVKSAYRHGRPVIEDPEMSRALPSGHDGPVTMITRIDPLRQRVVRALFPLRGHQVLVSPDRRSILFIGMNDDSLLRADFETLSVAQIATPHRESFRFGGHGCFSADGKLLLVAERRDPDLPFTGNPSDHFGVVSLRDPESLAVIGRIEAFGIAPHEIGLMPDGRTLAVANYGSTAWPRDLGESFEGLPFGVEPSVTLVDIRSGELLGKFLGPDQRTEIRHLVPLSGHRIAAVPVRPTRFQDAQRTRVDKSEVYEPDRTDHLGRGYLPAALLHLAMTGPQAEVKRVLADPPGLMQRGQSIVYDPIYDEAIVTYPTSQTLVVTDGRRGSLKQVISTEPMGLFRPRGIALLPDGVHYAVSGHWRDIYVFQRGTHQLNRDACRYERLFGHSHLTVA